MAPTRNDCSLPRVCECRPSWSNNLRNTSSLPIALLLFIALLLTGCTAPGRAVYGPDSASWVDVDESLRSDFITDYEAAGTEDRPVFRKHLPRIGPVAMLDYLEERYAICHGQAHNLGKELFAQSGDLMLSLQICGTRCTSACMHGVVGEALGAGGGMHQDIRASMEGFCSSEAMAQQKRGNCAHAIGHALLLNLGELGVALDSCNGFEMPAMRYYCATGVYMQYWDGLYEGDAVEERPTTLYPCDEQALFPAACYRYIVPFIKEHNDLQGQEIIAVCIRQPTYQRRGCFHGFGMAYMPPVIERLETEPGVLGEVCLHGTLADQSMCVEGVIEKMADYDRAAALKACGALEGEIAEVCTAAARGGMYRLDKPTLKYYLPPG